MLMDRPFTHPCAQESEQDTYMMDETLLTDKSNKSSHPPTDEQSEVTQAYQSGEQHCDRPASTLAGIQPDVSLETAGVGAVEQDRCDCSVLTTAIGRSLPRLRAITSSADVSAYLTNSHYLMSRFPAVPILHPCTTTLAAVLAAFSASVLAALTACCHPCSLCSLC